MRKYLILHVLIISFAFFLTPTIQASDFDEEIVNAGYANVMTIPPNVKYKDRFLNAYKQAREMENELEESKKENKGL